MTAFKSRLIYLSLGLTLLAAAVVVSRAQTVTTPAIGVAVCAYNSSPPTGTSGTFILVQCDSTGKLKIQ